MGELSLSVSVSVLVSVLVLEPGWVVVGEVVIASVVIFVEVAIVAPVLVGGCDGALLEPRITLVPVVLAPALVTESAGHISAK